MPVLCVFSPLLAQHTLERFIYVCEFTCNCLGRAGKGTAELLGNFGVREDNFTGCVTLVAVAVLAGFRTFRYVPIRSITVTIGAKRQRGHHENPQL